jgi:hypothetical protein
MTFKDELAADLDNVFFNELEFAEGHIVEGQEIICVIDSDRGQAKNDGNMYGLAEADFILLAKSVDLPRRKESGELLNLDGKELTVSYWDEQQGMAVIGLVSPVTA